MEEAEKKAEEVRVLLVDRDRERDRASRLERTVESVKGQHELTLRRLVRIEGEVETARHRVRELEAQAQAQARVQAQAQDAPQAGHQAVLALLTAQLTARDAEVQSLQRARGELEREVQQRIAEIADLERRATTKRASSIEKAEPEPELEKEKEKEKEKRATTTTTTGVGVAADVNVKDDVVESDHEHEHARGDDGGLEEVAADVEAMSRALSSLRLRAKARDGEWERQSRRYQEQERDLTRELHAVKADFDRFQRESETTISQLEALLETKTERLQVSFYEG